MKWFYGIICLLILAVGSSARADVDPQLTGIYVGSLKYNDYFNTPVQKGKATVSIEIDGGLSVITVTRPDEPLETYNGFAMQLGPYLFLKYETTPSYSLSGRIQIKGKPGKQSLSGVLHLDSNGYAGFMDYSVKVKQVF